MGRVGMEHASSPGAQMVGRGLLVMRMNEIERSSACGRHLLASSRDRLLFSSLSRRTQYRVNNKQPDTLQITPTIRHVRMDKLAVWLRRVEQLQGGKGT